MVVQSIAMRLLRLVKHVGRWRRQAWGTFSTHAGYDGVLAVSMVLGFYTCICIKSRGSARAVFALPD
jgi:hypothetical protein